MLKDLVLRVLNQTVGEYFENIDASQLQLSVFGGDVALHNLKLKANVCESLGLPFRLAAGRCGTLTLKIPWTSLYSQPVEIGLKDLYLLVVTGSSIAYDEEVEEKAKTKAKMRTVENIEAAQREFSLHQQQSVDGIPLADNQSGYIEKLAMQIVRNLQIRIESIHVRYEDDQANSNKPFGMGAVLTNLSILTTDSEWNPKYISENVSTIHKLLKLEGLAVYWNSQCRHISKCYASEEERINRLRTMLTEDRAFDYMVGPIQTTTKLRLNPTPEKNQFSSPKMMFETVVEELALSMSNLQFQDVLQLAENWDFLYRRQLHRNFRPQITAYKGHYRTWWKFAYNCVLENIQRKRNNWRWVRMHFHRKDCRAYYNAMYKKVTAPKKVTPEIEEEISNLEARLDLFNILLVRKQVYLRRERKEKEDAVAKKNQGWLGWFGSKTESSGPESFIPDEMSAEEKTQLYSAIGYSENSPLVNYPEDYVEVSVDFKLEKLRFLILNNNGQEISTVLDSQIENFQTDLQTRPVNGGLKLGIKLENIEAYGGYNDVQIITSRKETENAYFIDMGFEKYPLKTKLDQRIYFKGQPLEITYDSKTVQKLCDCFTVSEKISLQRLQAKALSKYVEWKAHSTAGLKRLVENRGKTEVDITLEAPYFIVPRDGDILTASSVLVVELGELIVKSQPAESVTDSKVDMLNPSSVVCTPNQDQQCTSLAVSTILNLTYDTFTIQLLNFQVSLAFAGETYRTSRTSVIQQQKLQQRKIKKQEPIHLIKSGVVLLKIEQCIVSDDARFPRFKVQSSLPNIDLDIPEHRLVQLVQLLVTLPLPKVPVNDIRDLGSESSEIHLNTDPTLNESMAVTQITYMDVANQDKTVEPIQLTALVLSVTIDSVKIRVSRQSTGKEVGQMIALELFSFNADMTSKTFGTSVDVKLGGVSLYAMVGRGMEKPLYLIRNMKSPADNKVLFHVHIFTITPDCPKSLSQKQIKQHISIGVSSMEAVLHREVLSTLVDFLQELMSTVSDEIANHEIRIQEEEEISIGKKRKQKSRIQIHSQAVAKKFGSDPNEILLKIEAKLEQLTVLMATNQKEIMKVEMKNLNGSYAEKFDKAEVYLQLIEFGIMNLDSTSLYKKILSFDSDRVIFIHVTKYHNVDPTKKEDITKCSIRLKIETGSPKVYILNSFLAEILGFTGNFKTATKAVKDAGLSAAEAATKNVKQAYNQDNNRISINIELKAPKIILPENDHSVTAIVFDFGNLNFSNIFSQLQVKNKYAILDEMGLNIENVKVSRVIINKSTQDPVCECLLLDPVTFTGFIKRNLSSDWYREIPGVSIRGKLHSTVIRVSSEDYQVLVGCVNDKLMAVASIESDGLQDVTSTDSKLGIFALEQQVDTISSSNVSFSMDLSLNNLGAVLYQGSSRMVGKTGVVQRDSKYSLAEFFIDSINAEFSVMDEDCFKARVVLGNVDLKDSRPEKRAITNLIQRKSGSAGTGPMIKFRAKKTTQEIAIDLTTTSLTFLLCLDHVVQVSNFFSISYGSEKAIDTHITPSKFRRKHAVTPQDTKKLKGIKSATQLKEQVRTQSNSTPFNGHFKLQAMEFVFVEDIEAAHNTNAVILNCEMSMNITTHGEEMDIDGVLEGLKLNTCNFNPEYINQTLAEVFSPTTVRIKGKQSPQVGLEIEVSVSDMYIRLSAGTVTLLTKIADSFKISSPNYLLSNQFQDYSEIWDTKDIKNQNLWYLTPGIINERNCLTRPVPESPKFSSSDLKLPVLEKSHEKLIFKSGSIVLTFEAGSDVITAPLLLIEASSEFRAVDWSTELELGGRLQLAAAYFNASVGMWEYLVEPVPVGKYQSFNWKPLEVLFTLNQGQTDEFSHLLRDSQTTLICLSDEDGVKRGTEIVCTFQINDVVEFTLTKTALNVLSMLGNTFESARGTKKLMLKNKISTAPYILNNFTGVDLHVDLSGTPFVVLNDETNDFNKRFKLISGNEVELRMATEYTRYSILKEQQMEEERWIRIAIPHTNFQARISIGKAQIRCYNLSSTGDVMTCEVWVKDCSRVVTFRGAVQIINDLNVDVDVITEKDGHVCTLESKSGPYSVPLKYLTKTTPNATSGFYFAPTRFKQSTKPFEPNQINSSGPSTSKVQDPLEDSSKMTKFLSCPNYAGDETFYIKVVSKSRQIYLENTKRLALNCMNHEIRLEPTFLINNMLPVPIAYVNNEGTEIEVAERGKMIQVTNLSLNGNSNSLIDIPLRVKGYDGLSWDCRISIGKNTDKLSAWSFVSVSHSRELTLGVFKDESNEEQLVLHLYAPFWMINRSGLNLSYKGEREKQVVKHPTDRQIVIFSYPPSTFFNKTNKARVKCDDSDWSAPFATETVGLSSFLSCKSVKRNYQFGITIKLCHGGLTKMIIFTPKYYVMNQCSYLVNLSEVNSNDEIELQPGICIPMWPKGADPRLGIRVDEENTKPFLYGIGHSTLLKLNNQYGALQVDVNVGETRIVITLSEYTVGKAPNLFLNATDDMILGFRQTGQQIKDQSVLLPGQSQLVSWPDPAGTRIMLWYPLKSNLTPSISKEFEDSIVSDNFVEFQWKNTETNTTGTYYWISFVEELQRITVLTKDGHLAKYLKSSRDVELPSAEIVLMITGLGLSLVDSSKCREIIYMRLSSTGVLWEEDISSNGRLRPFQKDVSESLETFYQIYTNNKSTSRTVGVFKLDNGMEVDLKAMKLVRPHERNIRRCPKMPGLWTHVKIFPHSTQFHLKVNKLQIDNQLGDATFVFLLAPVSVAKSVATTNEELRKPFVEMVFSMNSKNVNSSSVSQYIYCSFLVQEFQVKLDMGLINALSDLFSIEDGSADNKIGKIMEDLRKDYLSATMPLEEDQKKTIVSVGNKRFYNYLHLSPLKVRVSFSMNGSSNESSNVLLLLLQGLGIDKLADFQDVPFQLACFELQSKELSDDQLVSKVISHYTTQGIKQFYVLILGLDFLGNPYALLTGITEGIGAFFYEPIQGAILGPDAFKEGLSLGVKSLVGHTVGGAAEALSKVTGTIGKGFAALTMDDDFQKKRNESLRQGQGQGQSTSFGATARGFFKTGIMDTVAGIVTNPIKGAQEEGFQGFGKGLLRGAVGIVTRPVVGAADLARGTLDTFRRAFQDSGDLNQIRPPRPVHCSYVLEPYNMHAGQGNQIIQELARHNEKPYLKKERYLSHADVNTEHVLLLTENRLFYLKLTDTYGGSTIIWEQEWSDFAMPPYAVEKGIEFQLKPSVAQKKTGGFLRQNTLVTQLFVPMIDPELCMWIMNEIVEAMLAEQKEVKDTTTAGPASLK